MNDTSPEIEKLHRQMVMRLTPQERIEIACEMFAAARDVIIASLPKDLSRREFKRQLYYRTYGEPLPEDFPFDE